jgi:hypothetical protein
MVFAVLVVVAGFGQTGDVAVGASTLLSSTPASSIINSGNPYAPSMGGGTYLSFSGDYTPWHDFGFGGEVSWRASQNLYLGYQPYRPIFYSANAVWAPKLGKHFGIDLLAGIGAESLRFYTNYYQCNYVSCVNYVSSNHFMGVFGGGLKAYVHGGLFIRPEVRLYAIRNNEEFNSGTPVRAGVSIGYTFGGGQ